MIHVGKYQKAPVVVQAIPVIKGLFPEIRQFIGNAFIAAVYLDPEGKATSDTTNEWGIILKTLEGEIIAREGDYIIKGVEGEFYPIKQHIFHATYIPIEGEEQ